VATKDMLVMHRTALTFFTQFPSDRRQPRQPKYNREEPRGLFGRAPGPT
jgi:hypothetical protein